MKFIYKKYLEKYQYSQENEKIELRKEIISFYFVEKNLSESSKDSFISFLIKINALNTRIPYEKIPKYLNADFKNAMILKLIPLLLKKHNEEYIEIINQLYGLKLDKTKNIFELIKENKVIKNMFLYSITLTNIDLEIIQKLDIIFNQELSKFFIENKLDSFSLIKEYDDSKINQLKKQLKIQILSKMFENRNLINFKGFEILILKNINIISDFKQTSSEYIKNKILNFLMKDEELSFFSISKILYNIIDSNLQKNLKEIIIVMEKNNIEKIFIPQIFLDYAELLSDLKINLVYQNSNLFSEFYSLENDFIFLKEILFRIYENENCLNLLKKYGYCKNEETSIKKAWVSTLNKYAKKNNEIPFDLFFELDFKTTQLLIDYKIKKINAKFINKEEDLLVFSKQKILKQAFLSKDIDTISKILKIEKTKLIELDFINFSNFNEELFKKIYSLIFYKKQLDLNLLFFLKKIFIKEKLEKLESFSISCDIKVINLTGIGNIHDDVLSGIVKEILKKDIVIKNDLLNLFSSCLNIIYLTEKQKEIDLNSNIRIIPQVKLKVLQLFIPRIKKDEDIFNILIKMKIIDEKYSFKKFNEETKIQKEIYFSILINYLFQIFYVVDLTIQDFKILQQLHFIEKNEKYNINYFFDVLLKLDKKQLDSFPINKQKLYDKTINYVLYRRYDDFAKKILARVFSIYFGPEDNVNLDIVKARVLKIILFKIYKNDNKMNYLDYDVLRSCQIFDKEISTKIKKGTGEVLISDNLIFKIKEYILSILPNIDVENVDEKENEIKNILCDLKEKAIKLNKAKFILKYDFGLNEKEIDYLTN